MSIILRKFSIGLTLLVLAATPSPLISAQIANVTDETSTPIPGSGHDYIQALSETVNPANGSVSLRLAVPVPGGRSLTLPFSFNYDSNGVFALTSFALGQAKYSATNGAYFYSGGWSYAFPTVSYAQVSVPDIQKNSSCQAGMDYVFTSAAGDRHAFGIGVMFTTGECSGGNTLSGGESMYRADLENNGEGPLFVHDRDGTSYEFARAGGRGSTSSSVSQQISQEIEDRNGNIVTYSADPNCKGAITMTDTAGRAAVSTSGFGATGNTVMVSGLAQPYQLSWATVPAAFSMAYTFSPQPPSGETCNVTLAASSQNVITAITLPNGQAYHLTYDPTYGLLTEIQYPTGGYIQYVWGTNAESEYGRFVGAQTPVGGPTIPAGICPIIYGTPAIQHRYVSYDGSTVAEQQDFSYTTTWGGAGGNPWSSKQTTVTTHDLVTGSVFKTVYTYSSVDAPIQPQFVFPNFSFADQIPVEQTVVHQDTNGAALETVTESWNDPYLLKSRQTTLSTGMSSKVNYSYSSSAQLTEKDEYDYGQSSITRKTVTNYQAFSTFPPYLTYSPIYDRPCQTIVSSGAGSSAAETDYLYDGGSAVCGAVGSPSVSSISGLPAGTHDETYYSASSSIARGNVTSIISRCFPSCTDLTTAYAYDETGQPVSMTDSKGNLTQYSFADNPPGGNPAGNSNAYLTKITLPPANGVAHIDTYTWAASMGKMTSHTDQNHILTNYSYSDPLARLTLVDAAVGTLNFYGGSAESKTAYSYPSATETDAAQDQFLTGDGVLKSSTVYDGMGHPIKTVGHDGAVVRTAYDGLGRVCAASNKTFTDPGPLNCSSNRPPASPTDGYTYFAYDPLSRPTQQTQPDGTKLQWSYTGNVVDFYDEDYSHWQRTSDSFGRLTKVLENDPGGSGQLTLETDYSYDALNDLVSVNQKGASGDTPRTRTFAYDSLARLTSATNPETGTVAYSYANGGLCSGDPANVCSRTDARGVVTNYSYDALNRILTKSYPNDPAKTPTLSYTYDTEIPWQEEPNEGNPIGHLNQIQATVDSGILDTWLAYDYDQMGRMLGQGDCILVDVVTCNSAGALANAWWDFNLDGTLYDTQTNFYGACDGSPSDCGQQIMYLSYGYDSAGRLNSIATQIYLDDSDNNLATAGFSSPTYNALGQITNASLALDPTTNMPAIALSRSYDNRGRRTGEIDANPALQPVYDYSVNYDGNGNVTGFSDSVSGTFVLGNDSLHRLISGSITSGITAGETFQETYDHFGNRNQQTISVGSGGISSTYLNFSQGNNNRVDGWSYDAAGNLLDDGVNRYRYDGEGRLCAVYEYSSSGAMIGYYYGADGRRLTKTTLTSFSCDLTQNGAIVTNGYAYGPNGEELEEVTGAEFNFSHFNIFLEGELLGTFTGTTYNPANWEYALNDWEGTKRVIANYDGSVSTSFVSGPFGDYLSNTGSGADPSEQHFTGKDRDLESGNDYFGARYYSSAMGRFMSPDPSGLFYANPSNPQSLNLYSYGQNNPLTNTDPTGLDCVYINNDTGGFQGFNSGDCNNSTEASANSGYYVDGTVNSIAFNSQSQVIGYSTTTGSEGDFNSFAGSTDMSAGPASAYLNPYTGSVSSPGQNVKVNDNNPQNPNPTSLNLSNLLNPTQLQNFKFGQHYIGPYTPPTPPKLTGDPACFGAPDAVSDIHNLERGNSQNKPQGSTDGQYGASIWQSTTQGNRPFGNAGANAGFAAGFMGADYLIAVGNCLQGH